MVGVVEIASTSQIMSFVHYAQDSLRLPQYLGYTPYFRTLVEADTKSFAAVSVD